MSTEARKPPAQIALKIRRVLGGKAGWNGVAVQFAFAAVLGWIAYEIVSNARANLENQHIAAGFGFLREQCRLRRQPDPDLLYRLGHVPARVRGRAFEHARGLGGGHRLRHRDRLHRRAVPAVAQLAAVARRRDLCRDHPQPAGAVPDPVLVPGGARGLAQSAAEHFAARHRLHQQSRSRHSAPDRRERLRGVPGGAGVRHRGFAGVAHLCAAGAVPAGSGDPDLALCAGPAVRAAARHHAGSPVCPSPSSCRSSRASISPAARGSFRNSWR